MSITGSSRDSETVKSFDRADTVLQLVKQSMVLLNRAFNRVPHSRNREEKRSQSWSESHYITPRLIYKKQSGSQCQSRGDRG